MNRRVHDRRETVRDGIQLALAGIPRFSTDEYVTVTSDLLPIERRRDYYGE